MAPLFSHRLIDCRVTPLRCALRELAVPARVAPVDFNPLGTLTNAAWNRQPDRQLNNRNRPSRRPSGLCFAVNVVPETAQETTSPASGHILHPQDNPSFTEAPTNFKASAQALSPMEKRDLTANLNI